MTRYCDNSGGVVVVGRKL